jgi:hypothetical protein
MTCFASFFRASTLLIASVAPAQIVCMATGPDPIANPPFPPVVPGFTVAGGYANLAPPVDGKCPPNPSPCKFSFDFSVSIAAAAPPQPALDLCLGVPLFPPLLCSLLTSPPWNVTNPLPDLTRLVALGVSISQDCGTGVEWSIRANGAIPPIVFAHPRFYCSGC